MAIESILMLASDAFVLFAEGYDWLVVVKALLGVFAALALIEKLRGGGQEEYHPKRSEFADDEVDIETCQVIRLEFEDGSTYDVDRTNRDTRLFIGVGRRVSQLKPGQTVHVDKKPFIIKDLWIQK